VIADTSTERWAPVHHLLARAFSRLDEHGVPWCVLRRADELEHPHGDVDLLVGEPFLPRASRIFVDAGFTEVPASPPGSHRFFVAYDSADDCWLVIDVVSRLAFGRLFALETDCAERCIRSRRRDGPVFVPAPADAFWALFLHCALDKRAFPLADGRRLEELSRSTNGDAGAVLGSILHLCPSFESDAALAAVRRGDWLAASAAGESLERLWWRTHTVAATRALLANAGRRALDSWTVLLRRQGITVAVLGIDGAGKTTLIDGLREGVPFPVHVIYGGMWGTSSPSGPLAKLGQAVRPLTRPFGIWARYGKARWHRTLGRLVLFDRYTYDAYLPPEKPFVTLKRAYFWLLAHSSPPPDLVILLDVPSQEAAARKPDEADPGHERHRLRLLELRQRLARMVVVDATRAPAVVRSEATELLWRRYRSGWDR
jgi:thymidylate kinase